MATPLVFLNWLRCNHFPKLSQSQNGKFPELSLAVFIFQNWLGGKFEKFPDLALWRWIREVFKGVSLKIRWSWGLKVPFHVDWFLQTLCSFTTSLYLLYRCSKIQSLAWMAQMVTHLDNGVSKQVCEWLAYLPGSNKRPFSMGQMTKVLFNELG